ncbi:MAG TPA: hypothetical protein VNN80_02505 [Polyangiaceae bacterium]|nr:hypothetical protein [Polyangiaceae bacterium]
MRVLATFVTLTLTAGLFVACGDDDTNADTWGGLGGTGGVGVAGAGGVAGTGGLNNAGGGASGCSSSVSQGCGLAGNAGTGGAAGTDGGAGPDAGDGDLDPSSCTGCLELRTVVASNADQGAFQIIYGSSTLDMSAAGATVTFRVSGLAPEQDVTILPYATDNSGFSFGAVGPAVEVGPEGFADLELELEAISDPDFDAANVYAVGILVAYTGPIESGADADAGDAADAGPATETLIVALDSVTFAGIDTDDLEFTSGAESFGINFSYGVQTTSVIHH